jgi:hypothetical protein
LTQAYYMSMRLFLVIFLISLGTQLFSQSDLKLLPKQKIYNQSIQFSVENGILISNGTTKSNQLLDRSYYNGLEIKYGWTKTNVLNTYNLIYRFPTLGIGWYSSTFQNSDIGKPNALFLYFSIPFNFEGNKKWTGSYIGSFGVAYNFNAFDSITNPTNILIGSSRNCYVHFGYNLNYHINNRWTTIGSVGFKHFSNGATTLPNKGINLMPFSLGIKYNLNDKKPEKPDFSLPVFIPHNQWNIMFAAGYKNIDIGGEKYYKSTLGFNYLRQVSYKYRFGGGLDFFYTSSANYRNDSNESDFSKAVSYAVVGSWEWVLNKVIYVPVGLGLYLHRNVENGETDPYYARIGMRFRMDEHYNAGVTIKAHGGHADYFEWSFIYTIHKDPNKYQ